MIGTRKKVICICNTYYQLIFAINLRNSIYSEDCFVVLLSDHSQNAMSVYHRLRETSYFDDIFYIETRGIDYDYKNGHNIIRGTLQKMDIKRFDVFLFFNISRSSRLLFSYLYNNNNNIEVYRYEEGVLSYNIPIYKQLPLTPIGMFKRILYFFRKIVKRWNLIGKIDGFYCNYPELYYGQFHAKRVPLVQRGGTVGDTIAKAFSTEKCVYEYKEKYIYFTSVYDFEGGKPIGEYQLVQEIAKIVGKDNLLIKMHPRDTRKVFFDAGFHIDKNSTIPFEALLIAFDFSNKIILTATSGVAMSIALMVENPPQIFYMYPLCKVKQNDDAQNTIMQIESVLENKEMKNKLQCISVCHDIRDIVC